MIDFGYGIHLSDVRESNLSKLKEARNDTQIREWCRQFSLISDFDQDKWYERINTDPSIQMFEIIKNHALVGVCGFTSIDRVNQNAEFSLYLFPKQLGKGYSKPVLQTLFSHGFCDQNFHRIWGETFEGNHAKSIFDKIGMIYEGENKDAYFKNGKFISSNRYRMLREDFFEQEKIWNER